MESFEDREIPARSESELRGPSQDKLDKFLHKLGADEHTIDRVRQRARDVRIQDAVRRFRAFAQDNPAVILTALSAIVVGGAVVATERVVHSRRAAAKRNASAKRSASTKRTRIRKSPSRRRSKRTS